MLAPSAKRIRRATRRKEQPAVSYRDVSATRPEGQSVVGLIQDARRGGRDPLGELLQLYRNYLTILATAQMGARLRRRLDPSDLVQDTMLAAHRDFAKFRGQTEREFIGWLRQVLIHCLNHAIEIHVKAKKRDVRCEISIDQLTATVDRSDINLGTVLADPRPSPSAEIGRRERCLELADHLARLKPQYRDVIVLRNLQGLTFDEIAVRMNRKPNAIRMLWLRAMEKLKSICRPVG